MEKLEPEEIIKYKHWFKDHMNKVIHNIELSASGITKKIIFADDIFKILNNEIYERNLPPVREYDVISRYFDNIEIEADKKTGNSIIKAWSKIFKTKIKYNFYETVTFPVEKKILVLGHIDGIPYEYKYYYKDLYHLDRIFRETFIQNCLYAEHEKRPDLKLKGDKKNETQID